ncbi:flavin reductase [Micromonospora sp. NPDC048839]|uniref:flavin reductase n=1 Tax=Micromonospora sp. NPDC048839 TaxID=3155641 RepID=UPI0033F0646E
MIEEPTTVRAARANIAQRSVKALPERLQGEHLPSQPTWDCASCEGQIPWPCDPARARLAEAYGENRISLSMYLASLLDAALVEMPDTSPAELHERFVSWTR